MNTPDKCPHCRAIRVEGREYACGFIFREGVKNNPRPHECLLNSEVSAHAATRKELEEYRKERQEFIDRDNAMKMAAQDDAARIAKSESRVHELEKEVTEALELALDQCGAERLSGNIVKEEYWNGELAAIRRMKQAIGEMPGGGK